VFPENALMGEGENDPTQVDAGVEAIRQAARKHAIYVFFGGRSWFPPQKRATYWLYVIGPAGRDLLRYDKLFDQPQAPMPGVFAIDGVPCSTYLCADRWLRGVQEIPIQQGARISFELSCNTANEWVAPFAWYWNVPQALRNSVWVIFANTGNTASGVADSGVPGDLRHGHSAVIAPDGRLVAAARDDVARILFAEIDVGEATRAEALARAAHPVLRGFWDAGVRLHRGENVEAPALAPTKFSATPITLAASQVTGDATAMAAKVREARAKGADLIAFPAHAVAESALRVMQAAARENQITVVFGAEHRDTVGLHNSAFVIGPDGAPLTRYDQLSATAPFAAGLNPAAMSFRVKGVPAVVTLERDGLWTELSELAAVAGARIHVHLDHDLADDPDARLRRLQVWANLASYLTFSVTVSESEAMVWDDLSGLEERRGGGEARLMGGEAEVFSPFSANLVARAAASSTLLVATRTVSGPNPYYSRLPASKNPKMAPWFRLGASLLAPGTELKPAIPSP
jgi:predicted amidohydrolase